MLMEPIFNLPRIQFVGGEAQELRFNLKNENGENYVTNQYRANFSVARWGESDSTPIISKEAYVITNAAGTLSMIDIELNMSETIGLYGRYKYQITIFGENDKPEIPGQGILEITRNINPGYLTV